jgi:hypothetical protein
MGRSPPRRDPLTLFRRSNSPPLKSRPLCRAPLDGEICKAVFVGDGVRLFPFVSVVRIVEILVDDPVSGRHGVTPDLMGQMSMANPP